MADSKLLLEFLLEMGKKLSSYPEGIRVGPQSIKDLHGNKDHIQANTQGKGLAVVPPGKVKVAGCLLRVHD